MNQQHDPELGSAADIARLLSRSRHGTKKALARLNITPSHRINRIPVYPMAETAEILLKEMRAANKSKVESGAKHV